MHGKKNAWSINKPVGQTQNRLHNLAFSTCLHRWATCIKCSQSDSQFCMHLHFKSFHILGFIMMIPEIRYLFFRVRKFEHIEFQSFSKATRRFFANRPCTAPLTLYERVLLRPSEPGSCAWLSPFHLCADHTCARVCLSLYVRVKMC